MSGRIPTQVIDEILARTDILTLIGARLQLRRAGRDYQARCPFHEEKTPSFTVSPEKQFYHCFGCGAHGTAIDFLMHHDRLDFRAAVEELARAAGIALETDDAAQERSQALEPLYAINAQALELYRRQLREHPQAERAIDYLKGRGLTGEIASRYALGYAPPGGDLLLRTLGQTASAREQLLASGLLGEQDGRRYDRFRDRILFPIRDGRGRVIGFGGRLLGEGKPKYLNSPETPIFHKGRELYGLYEARQATRNPDTLIVVEGYLDVIALAQFGLPATVATLGTAMTPDQLRLMLKQAPDILFCFDGDRAGQDAAWKALRTALPLATGHQSLRFLFLPEGSDPDSLIRAEGAAALRDRMASALPLSTFLFDRLGKSLNLTHPEGRARLHSLAQPLIERVPPGIYRDLLSRQLAERSGTAAPAAPAGRSRGTRRPPPRAVTQRTVRPSRVAQMIALLLHRPALAPRAAEIADDWRRAPGPGPAILGQLLETLAQDPTLTSARLLERWRDDPHFPVLQRLSVHPFLNDIPPEGFEAELTGGLQRLGAEVRQTEQRGPLNSRSPTEWTDEDRARLEEQAIAARNRKR